MRKLARGLVCVVLLSPNQPYCRCTSAENNYPKIRRQRGQTQQSQPQGEKTLTNQDKKPFLRTHSSYKRILETFYTRNYEMPMGHLQLSYQQVKTNGQDGTGHDAFGTITTLRDSPNDASHSLLEVSVSVSAPPFILAYRVSAAISPGTIDIRTIEDYTRLFINEQLGKTFSRGGVGIAEKSFASIPEETNKSTDSLEIVFVPVFLFDSTWSTIPSAVDIDIMLVAMFSGQSLVEYISGLNHLDSTNAFTKATGVVFKRSQESSLDPDEKESSSTPYFAAACSGVITLLILFLWNQSMRMRNLMKRKAKGIETEAPGDEEEGNPRSDYLVTHQVFDRKSRSSLDESLREEAFRLPSFSCLLDLEPGSTLSQSTHENLKVHKKVKQSEKQRRDVSNQGPGFSSCAIVRDDGSYSSTDESHAYEAKPSILDSTFGSVQAFEKYKSRIKLSNACYKLSDDESYYSSDESYGVEACDSFGQLSALQKVDSALDWMFGTPRDSGTYKPQTKPIKKWKEASDDDNCSEIEKCFGVKSSDSLEKGQGTKESTFCVRDINMPGCDISSEDSDSSSESSPVEKAFDYISESQEGTLPKYLSVGEDEGSNINKHIYLVHSPKCENSTTIATSDSSQQTRLHAWLLNQGEVFGYSNNGSIETHTKDAKQKSPSNQGCPCSENTKVGDCLGPPFRYDSILRIKNQKRKPQQRKPATDHQGKGSSNSCKAILEPRINPSNLLQEMGQCRTTRIEERNDTTRSPPKAAHKTREISNILVCERKEKLFRQPLLSKNKELPAPKKRGPALRSGPNDFIFELKERLASLAMDQDNLRPITRDVGRIVSRASGDLIYELQAALANRQKRVPNYDFSAAESKNRSLVFPDGQLMIELKGKLAHRHQKVCDLGINQSQSNQKLAGVQVPLASVEDDEESTKEGSCDKSSFCRDSKSTETTDTGNQMDYDKIVSTMSELREHSAELMNNSPFPRPQLEDCNNEKKRLPQIVTMRKATEKNETTDKDANKRKEDPFNELSRLNLILKNQSDDESIATPAGAHETSESTMDIEVELQKCSKYPWKNVGEAEKTRPTTRKTQMLVVDFVAPGKTPTDRGNSDMDLLSRYKEDILKETRKRKSVERSVNSDQSIASMPSYKARLVPKKKEKPDSVPWWLPDETDSNTSSNSNVKNDDMSCESGDESSMDHDAISYGSSSYAATNSTSSSFFTNVLKQRQSH